jgi:ParB family chromosome partitioning protein
MKVSISQIRPSPFQVRQHIDRERLQALADEIKELGYWGSLRARKQGSHYELCFGHRRLEALKLAKIKEVDLEVVTLSDDDMQTYALVENLQREGLNDDEKSRGIQTLIERFEANGEKHPRERVAKLMGLSESRLSVLLSLPGLTRQSRNFIATGKISGTTAVVAKRIGGDERGEEMIATAVKHALPKPTLEKIQRELIAIEEPDIRKKVTNAVIAGKLRDPESVRQRERQLRAETAGPSAKDLRLLIREWTQRMESWQKQLAAAAEYLDYIEGDPTGAEKFKTAARELIDTLKRFL